MGNSSLSPQDPIYVKWVTELKSKFRKTQLKAAVTVNTALVSFYWDLGADMVEKQKSAPWGSGFLQQLSKDLTAEFPEVKGFSYRNMRLISQWFRFYSDDSGNLATACCQIAKNDEKSPQIFTKLASDSIVNRLVQIPWGHNCVIISKCNSVEDAVFYVNQTIKHGWSRAVLTHQIEGRLYHREGKSVTNFSQTLPAPQSDLAQQIIKDPYIFDFLTLTDDFNERELEQGLIEHVSKFLIELGAGFAYLGKQIPLQVGERDFFVDLLFYHTQLHCYVVIELKTGDFEPEHAGKLNFYIKAIDEQKRSELDAPTIGILLCKNHDSLVAEYSLSDINKPMGVSEYQLTQCLPENLRSILPSVAAIEAELSNRTHHD